MGMLDAIGGNEISSNYHSLNLAGTVALKVGQLVSLWVYSNVATQINSESGFSCHLMGTHKGFHAKLRKDIRYSIGWSTLKGWRTWGTRGSYGWGGSPSADGSYTAPESGFYACAAQIQTRSLSKTGAKIVITLKGDTNDFTGLLAMGGSRRSIDQRTLMVAGTIALKSGWEASVKIFTRDNNWTAKSSSGFSCHLIKTFDGCMNKQSAQSLARVFSIVKDKMKNTDNLVGADTSV